MKPGAGDPEEQILHLLAHDDAQALAILFNTYYTSLVQIAYQALYDRSQADDLVLDFFVALWEKRHQLSLKKPLEPYLIRAVLNRCYNYVRDAKRKETVHYKSTEELETLVHGIESDSPMDLADMKLIWRQALHLMSPKTRVVFLLSRKQSMTYREIALHLGISEKTVEKHVSQALLLLRKVFGPYLLFAMTLVVAH